MNPRKHSPCRYMIAAVAGGLPLLGGGVPARARSNAKGSTLHYHLGEMLGHASLSLNDVQLQFLDPPQIISAVANKAIDAAVSADPTGAYADAERGWR